MEAPVPLAEITLAPGDAATTLVTPIDVVRKDRGTVNVATATTPFCITLAFSPAKTQV